ncbi:MAG: hypothetical protein M3069_08145, partial [Chloroflexota bacterium]|nr:hypothetical protein [Chloroflexota bacterium]
MRLRRVASALLGVALFLGPGAVSVAAEADGNHGNGVSSSANGATKDKSQPNDQQNSQAAGNGQAELGNSQGQSRPPTPVVVPPRPTTSSAPPPGHTVPPPPVTPTTAPAVPEPTT